MGAPPASSCRHGRRSWASARFTCDLQWGGGVGSSLRHDFLGAILSVPAMTVSRWPYLFLIAVAVALVGISATVQPAPESKRELELYIRHCRRLTEANCLKCSFRLMVSYSMDRKLHRQEEFCRAMLLRCNASCVLQRCGLTISLFEDQNAQEFNVVTEQSKILGFFDILEQLPTYIRNRGGQGYLQQTLRALRRASGRRMHGPKWRCDRCLSGRAHSAHIRRCFHCRFPHKHTVPIKDSYGTAWMF